jgi:hypothetical protein
MRQTMVHRDKLAAVEGDLTAAQVALAALRAEFEAYKVEARAHEQQVGVGYSAGRKERGCIRAGKGS